jgi:hypothetical protein
MINSDIVHVAAMSPAKLETTLVEKVAPIIARDPYSTRLLLSGKMPRLLIHYHSLAEAESTVRLLTGMGLVAFVCSDAFLRTPFPAAFRPRALDPAAGEIVFRDSSGVLKTVMKKDVILILKGKKQNIVEAVTTTTKMKFSMGKTLMTGGIPMWSKEKVKTAGNSVQTEYFARLYGRVSPEPLVDLMQQNLDYGFLKEKLTSSSTINFSTVINELRLMFSGAFFDDRLASGPSPEITSVTAATDFENNCKLLYLYYAAVDKASKI